MRPKWRTEGAGHGGDRALGVGAALAALLLLAGVLTRLDHGAVARSIESNDRAFIGEDRLGAPSPLRAHAAMLHGATGVITGRAPGSAVALMTAPVLALLDEGQTFRGVGSLDATVEAVGFSAADNCELTDEELTLTDVLDQVVVIASADEVAQLGAPLTLHAAGGTSEAIVRDRSEDGRFAYLTAPLPRADRRSCDIEDHVPARWIPLRLEDEGRTWAMARRGGAGLGEWDGFAAISLDLDQAPPTPMSAGFSETAAVVALDNGEAIGIVGMVLPTPTGPQLASAQAVLASLDTVVDGLADGDERDRFGVALARPTLDAEDPICQIEEVLDDTEAAASGIAPGDAVLDAAGERTTTWSGCRVALAALEPGEQLTIDRDGRSMTLEVRQP